MKKTLLLTFLLCMIAWCLPQNASAQCSVDSSFTAPGIYPDTLPDACVGDPYSEVVNFVFPSDTVIFGQTVAFDSFVVTAVNNVPAGLTWECNMNHPTCTYLTTPGQFTRGCVQITGTATTPNLATDSVEVIGQGWVTIPIIGAYAAEDTIRMGLLVKNCGTAAAPSIEQQLGLTVSPNPIASDSRVTYTLPAGAHVRITVVDMFGRTVAEVAAGDQAAGYHAFSLGDLSGLAGGTYMVKFNLNQGEFSTTRKVVMMK